MELYLSAFEDPEVQAALWRMAVNMMKVLGYLAYLFLVAMALWHGFSIGLEGDWFHLEHRPMKRFF